MATCYFLFAEIGHALSFPGDFATFWLPSGLALAAYLSVPTRRWPWVAAGTLAANLVSDVFFHHKTLPVSCGFWIANLTESLSAAWLTVRFLSQPFRLARSDTVIGFVLLPCLVCTAIGATLGAAVVTYAFGADYADTWRIWWSGDVLGMLIGCPFVLVIVSSVTDGNSFVQLKSRRRNSRSIWLFLSVLAVQMLIAEFVFGRQTQRIAYVTYPVLLWLSLRFHIVGAATGLFATALITVAHTANGNGTFGEIPEVVVRASVLQIFLFITAAAFLIVGASASERTQAQASLHRTRVALDTAGDGVMWVDSAGRLLYVNDAACRRLQYTPQELLTMTVSDVDSDPGSVDEFTDELWPQLTQGKHLTRERRYRRKDGTTLPVEVSTHYIDSGDQPFACSFIRDITDRRRQDKLFQATFESSALALVLTDFDGKIVLVNDEARRLFGYDGDQLVGQTIEILVPAEFKVRHRLLREEFVKTPEKRRMQGGRDLVAIRADGSTVRVEIGLNAFVTEDGSFVLSTIVDITQRVEAQRQLEESQSKLRVAVEGGNVGLWDWDIATNRVSYSDEWHAQLGEPPGTLSRLSDWESRVHPDDRTEALRNVAELFAGSGAEYESTFRMRHRDGSYRWILARGRLFRNENGEPARMVGTHVDVTEREDMRSRLEAYLKVLGSTDGGWDWDVNSNRVEYAPRFRELLGFNPAGDPAFPDTLEAFDRRLHPEDKAGVWNRIRQHFEERLPYDHEFRMRLKNGSYRWFRSRADTVRDAHGRPARMAGSIYDVTRQKEAELRLQQSNNDLEEFAYVASHDLQEPLRAIGGFCQLLERKYSERLDERGLGYLRHVVDGVARMKDLIQDLLDFSRVSRLELNTELVDLSQCVAQAVDNLKTAITDSQASIEVGELPKIHGQHGLFTQLFQNLISNSIKFRIPGTSPQVTICAAVHDSSCVIEVADNGMGIPEEYQDCIFTMFKRLHRREEVAGTGIGLALCRRIVDRHHGTISVRSAPGEGATFVVTLPIV
ncbi:MAG: PAS domain S-box protein [Planctomycetaceae bacterium]